MRYRYRAITSTGLRSPVSNDREDVDGWAARQIKSGAEEVLVYAADTVSTKPKTGELVGRWAQPRNTAQGNTVF